VLGMDVEMFGGLSKDSVDGCNTREEKKYGNGSYMCMGIKEYYQQCKHWLETTHTILQNR
jgi:hypothetical protein